MRDILKFLVCLPSLVPTLRLMWDRSEEKSDFVVKTVMVVVGPADKKHPRSSLLSPGTLRARRTSVETG